MFSLVGEGTSRLLRRSFRTSSDYTAKYCLRYSGPIVGILADLALVCCCVVVAILFGMNKWQLPRYCSYIFGGVGAVELFGAILFTGYLLCKRSAINAGIGKECDDQGTRQECIKFC